MEAVIVKMDSKDKQQLKKDAHQHEMNVSEYIRYLVRKEREVQ